jgi:hypothetical protein
MTRDELLKNHEAICQEARSLMEYSYESLLYKCDNSW